MPRRIRWVKVALADLDEIAEYITQSNPAAAKKVAKCIWEATHLLSEHPGMGRTGRVSGTRELVVVGTPYIVPYRVKGDTVEILRVIHAARKWPRTFNRSDESV